MRSDKSSNAGAQLNPGVASRVKVFEDLIRKNGVEPLKHEHLPRVTGVRINHQNKTSANTTRVKSALAQPKPNKLTSSNASLSTNSSSGYLSTSPTSPEPNAERYFTRLLSAKEWTKDEQVYSDIFDNISSDDEDIRLSDLENEILDEHQHLFDRLSHRCSPFQQHNRKECASKTPLKVALIYCILIIHKEWRLVGCG